MTAGSVELGGLRFYNTTLHDMVDEIEQIVRHRANQHNIFPVNVDVLIKASNDLRFRDMLRSEGIILADGMPIVWLSKLLRSGLKERVAGSDLAESLLQHFQGCEVKFFLLGARPEIVAEAAARVEDKYNVRCMYFSPSRAEIVEDSLSTLLVRRINEASPDILMVGFGAPLQEKWIARYATELNTRVNIAVGGTIDFLSGNLNRAPVWVQEMGVEWIYRLLKEPRRLWKRYLIDDSKFILVVIHELLATVSKRR